VITSQKDGIVSTTLERKIPLVTIKSISMSTMRDDWLVSPYMQEYAPCINIF
jgi:myosin-1